MKNRLARLLATLPMPERGRLKPLQPARPATLATLRLESMALLVDAATSAVSIDGVLRLPDHERDALLRVVRAHHGSELAVGSPIRAIALRGTADTVAASRALFARLSRRLAAGKPDGLKAEADTFMAAMAGCSAPRGWTHDQASAARALLIAGGIASSRLHVEMLSNAHSTARLLWTGERELVDWHRPVALAVLRARAVAEVRAHADAPSAQTRSVSDHPAAHGIHGSDSTTA